MRSVCVNPIFLLLPRQISILEVPRCAKTWIGVSQTLPPPTSMSRLLACVLCSTQFLHDFENPLPHKQLKPCVCVCVCVCKHRTQWEGIVGIGMEEKLLK